MKKYFLFLSLTVLCIFALHADVLITQETVTPEIMGQPGSTDIMETWLGKGIIATLGKDSGVIIDMNSKKAIIINHASKSYVETDIPIDFSKLVSEEMAPMMEQMMQGMTVTVNKGSERKKVAGIDTESYLINMTMMGMPMNSTYWVAKKGLPFSWDDYRDIYMQMTQIQMRGGDTMIKELSKIDGFPLAMEIDFMGNMITTNTLEIKKDAKAPAGTYSAPEGYTKNDRLQMR